MLVRQLATTLGYRTETIQLYQVPYGTYLYVSCRLARTVGTVPTVLVYL
jgi:hypothetical protein